MHGCVCLQATFKVIVTQKLKGRHVLKHTMDLILTRSPITTTTLHKQS